MRWTFAVLSPIFLLTCVWALHSEEVRPWVDYQKGFKELYVAQATAKLQEAKDKNDAAEQARWQRTLGEVSRTEPEIAQVYLEDIKVTDRCTTCHRGIDNPLFHDAPQPYRTHPGDLLKQHDFTRFGCTPCHDGQGTATTVEGAHGHEANWLAPLLPAAYVQTTCARCHEVTHGLKGAEVRSRGADLFLEKGCYGCHAVKSVGYLPKYSPPLTNIRSKLRDPATWMYNWVRKPTSISAATAMPDFKLPDEEVAKITAFLLTLPAGEPEKPVPLEGVAASDGERLFTERGCRGCHGIKADEASVTPRVPNLTGVGSKVTAEWLDRWLTNPKQYNPDTAMPKIELTEPERRAIVAYLLTLKRADALPPAPDLTKQDTEAGKQLVKQYECFGCHGIEGLDGSRPAVPDLGEFARKPVDELDFATVTGIPRTKWDWAYRKFKEPRAYETDRIKLKMPIYQLSDEENRALVASVLTFDTRSWPVRYIVRATTATRSLREMVWMTSHLNCNGCHPLRNVESHLTRFTERKNLIPPTLDGVGARLQGQYMYQFILEPKPIRPWLKMRMPVFGFTEPQARTVVEGFAAATAVSNPYTFVASEAQAPDKFQRGIRRFLHFKCVQCHPTSQDQTLPEGVDPEDLSINLMLTKTRLRPEWIRDFLARPKQIAGAQTRMPTVFFTIDGEPKVEKPQEDINDITTYLMGMLEPPEVTLKAVQEIRAAEAKKADVDWSKTDY